MKVRLRSFKNRETMAFEVPVSCSLQQLKLILSERLSSSPHPDSIHLFLNKEDEIQSASPHEDTLQALGIASGDLIFYAVCPNCFSSKTLHTNSGSQPSTGVQEPQPSSMESQDWQHSDNSQVEHIDEPESSGQSSLDGMDIDDSGGDNNGESFYIPGFLRKVFAEELGSVDDGGRFHKLLVISVHAVLLESGFVGYDMNLKTETRRCQLQADRPSNLSMFYTLPGLIGNALPSSEYENGVVMLKFQSMGTFLNVYGSLKKASAVHSVHLREDELDTVLNIVWANCGLKEEILSRDGNPYTSPAREVFNFWKIVKDKLALPLLMDLCERAGLELPPCFARLPTELKVKVLESLPGPEIARMSCVSSELRYLCSNEDLWKQKYAEEFPHDARLNKWTFLKLRFAKSWLRERVRRRAEMHRRPRLGFMSRPPIVFVPVENDIFGIRPDFYLNLSRAQSRFASIIHHNRGIDHDYPFLEW